MRRSLSLILAILMVLSSLTVMSFTVSAETIELQGTRYGSGMENHTMAPDNEVGNPYGTVFMYGVVYNEIVTADTCNYMMTNSDNFEFKFTISKNKDMTGSVTKIWTPTNCEGFGKGFGLSSSYIVRFTPCLEAGENEWIPENGVVYYVNLEVKDLTTGTIYSVTGHNEGYVLNDDPVTKTTEIAIPDVEEPIEVNVRGAWTATATENWSGSSWFHVVFDNAIACKLVKANRCVMKATITDETAGVSHSFTCDSADGMFFATDVALRFEPTEYGIVPQVGHEYTVSVGVYNGDKLIYTGTSEKGLYKITGSNIETGGVIFNNNLKPGTTSTADFGFAGTQAGDSALRLVGYTDSVEYDTVGFEVIVTRGADGKKASLTTTSVFTSLKSGEAIAAATTESGVEAPVKVAHDYLYGYAIENIADGEYIFTVIPTATTGDVVAYGVAAQLSVTVANGVVTVA